MSCGIGLSSSLSVEVVSSLLKRICSLRSNLLESVIVLVWSKLLICLCVVARDCQLSSVFVCKPCGTHKCPSHVFVCLCKDYVIVFVQVVDVGCE